MLDTIKKYWWVVFLGGLIFCLIKFIWPASPKKNQVPALSDAQVMKIEKPEQAVTSRKSKPIPATLENNVQEVAREPAVEAVEEVSLEEEEVPAKQNYVLCEYIVSGESQYEFTGQIRLINKGNKPIYGWSVNWEFEDGSTIIESSGVALGGSNPYTGQYLPSNAEIAPGKTVTFYFTGIKGGSVGPRGIKIEGEFCM